MNKKFIEHVKYKDLKTGDILILKDNQLGIIGKEKENEQMCCGYNTLVNPITFRSLVVMEIDEKVFKVDMQELYKNKNEIYVRIKDLNIVKGLERGIEGS